jgi:ParB-like chromosome segregation protein Spo0J
MQVVDISTHALRASKSNPRKTFRHLEDLAKSLAEKGQLTPIIVRPLPKNGAERCHARARLRRASPLARRR